MRPFDPSAAHWSAAPETSRWRGGALVVEARQGSDFWRDPRTGAVKHDGHLLGIEGTGDLSIEATVGGAFDGLYDQAGLMICFDESRWIKLILDRVGERLHLATVVTDGWSDSALFPIERDGLSLRLSRIGAAVAAEIDDGGGFAVVRLARLDAEGPYRIGPMCCAPSRAGFTATFRDLVVGPPPQGLVA